MTGQRSERTGAVEEIHLLDLVSILLRRWTTLVTAVAVAVLVAIAAYLFWPGYYTSETVLVPSQGTGGGGVANLLGGSQIPSVFTGLLDKPTSGQALVGVILESESLADSMVKRLGYEDSTPEAAAVHEILKKRTGVQRGDGGSMTISVSAEDPQLAVRIADEYPALINGIVAHLSAQSAVRKQEFLERQLAFARRDLEESEQDLVDFQLAKEAPEVQEQAKRTLAVAADLQSKIMQQEVEVAQLRRAVTPSNPELRAAVSELEGWRSQLRQLTAGQGSKGEVFLSFREAPDLQVAATRILREYEKDEQVYTSLMAALVEAQVDARNDMPVITVLDRAELPLAPAKPSLALVILAAVLLGLAVGVGAAFAKEYAETLRRDPAHQKFVATWDQFKADLARVLRIPRRASVSGQRRGA